MQDNKKKLGLDPSQGLAPSARQGYATWNYVDIGSTHVYWGMTFLIRPDKRVRFGVQGRESQR